MSAQSPRDLEQEAQNKAIVLEGLDALFNRRDVKRGTELFSPDYIQHSRMVPAGRDGLFGLAQSLPEGAKHEHDFVVAEGDYVMVHGRFSGSGGPTLISMDIFRLKDGIVMEHWDVLQDEATKDESAGGYPMFGDKFA